jgi:pimeloyl-ACP methyl ester carboxylesterase
MSGICGRGLSAICLTIFVASALPSSAQEILFAQPPGSKFRASIAALPPDQQQAVRETVTEVFPVFVFLPGILGSKLVKKLPNGNDKLIWGQYQGVFTAPDPDLAYADTDQVTPDVLDEYYAFGKGVDVYGQAINTIKYLDLSSGDNVRLFAYDWRQSNVKSARRFSEWLGEKRSTIEGRPVVFMAHSMGGLVLKYWLKNGYRSEGCTSENRKFTEWIKIKKIIFLGTPHYGAPKAIAAFGDQYYLMVDPDTLVGKLFAGVDARTLSRSINLFGATFPSSYELLPIINTSDCFKDSDWPYPIEIRQPDNTSHTNIDLFNPSTWELFKWPKQLSPTIPRDKFVKEQLPSLLASAKTFLCGLAKYEPEDDNLDVTRVYGNKLPTVCKVVIIQPVRRDEVPTIETQRCDENDNGNGDGTVPTWIASEVARSTTDKTRPVTKGHADLLGSPKFISYLRSYGNELHRELQRRYQKRTGNVDGLVSMYASLRYVVPPGLGSSSDDATSLTARDVLARIDVDPKSIYVAAKGVSDALSRADAYRIFAFAANPDDLKRPWALNNAAHIFLDEGYFVTARELGKSAVTAADLVPGEAGKVKASASFTTAVAAKKLGDIDTAKTFKTIAVQYGNTKARGFIVD